MKTAKIKITDKADSTLKTELGLLEAEINDGAIEFKNSKGELKTCPFGAFTHTGRIAVSKDEDLATWNMAMDVVFRVEAEKRKSGTVASAKATHSMKHETASLTVRVAGMEAKKAGVTLQLAKAQKLAQSVREIRAELERRANADRLSVEKLSKVKLDADVADYLNGCPAAVAA